MKYKVCTLLKIIGLIRSRRMRRVGHIAHIAEHTFNTTMDLKRTDEGMI